MRDLQTIIQTNEAEVRRHKLASIKFPAWEHVRAHVVLKLQRQSPRQRQSPGQRKRAGGSLTQAVCATRSSAEALATVLGAHHGAVRYVVLPRAEVPEVAQRVRC